MIGQIIDFCYFLLLTGWRPIGTSSSGKTERDIERSSNRDNDDKVIHPTESKGLPQYRYPIQVSQEMKKSGNLEDAYNDLVQKLAEKRAAGNRPERLIDMTFAEVCFELFYAIFT